MSVNKVIILGRLGQDPELKYTPTGAAVCTFSVATSESWMDKAGQKQEKTEWHRVVVWGKSGENCGQYLKKGRQVYLEGRLQTRSWDDQSGQKRYTTEITANTVEFIGDRRPQDGGPAVDNNFGYNQEYQGQGGGAVASNKRAGSGPELAATISNDANYTADDIPF